MNWTIQDNEPDITDCPQCECGVVGDDYCPNCGGDAVEVFDRSALYTLAHNIQVGAALCASFELGLTTNELAAVHLDDCGWRPNVDGKGV